MNEEDVLEYIMAGANLTAMGFGVMVDPEIPLDTIKGLEQFLLNIDKSVDKISGVAQRG
jgi:dihydroorotate dehydrogenase